METSRRRDRRRGSGRRTWRRGAAGRLSRAEEESRGGSPNAGADGDGGEVSCERERSGRGQERSGPRDSEVGTSSSDRSRKRRRTGAEEESWLPSYSSSSTPSSVSWTRTQGRGSFTSLYAVGSMLGQGGCGSVYEGTRRADGLPVAIKFLSATYSRTPVYFAGMSRPAPLEVALMELACRPPASPNVIQLLDWFEEDEEVILVLELPSPCMDVWDFTARQGGCMGEDLAKVVMAQVVQAAIHCRDRGVLHRDIKPENLLIRTEDLGVKLIDFGCGDLLTEDPYTSFAGTQRYAPPEWWVDGQYCGLPATVWSLGVLLFALVCGSVPFRRQMDIIWGRFQFQEGLSDDCRSLILWCFQRDPRNRPELEEILGHPWMRQWSC